ncbi:LamG domain-containing protein [Reichenbachiella versicolor]|uniref:hypothetical protein n=1 Tax=Reichenbachiella versicolor TaxID=1821036 RepID=UPI001C86F1D9|nr:hypothetical protein [Reichenbachiella versicolor]
MINNRLASNKLLIERLMYTLLLCLLLAIGGCDAKDELSETQDENEKESTETVDDNTDDSDTENTDESEETDDSGNSDGSDGAEGESSDTDEDETTGELTAEMFENIDPDFPSFVSLINTTPEDKEWVKLETMSDEFDVWDDTKWFKSEWNYGVPVFMTKDAGNSGVTDGNLWIKATLNESNPEGRWFQSARIHSKAETGYPMYTEASIKTAHISAYNTYWLNKGEGGGGIYRDEIDIIENNSKPSCGCQPDFHQQMNSQYFHADNDLTPKEIRNKGNFLRTNLSDVNPLKNVGWNEEYHTYGVWWKDSRNVQFYLDGEPAGSVVVGEHNDGTYHPDRFFTRELEIIFDLWTNEATWLGGLPPKSDLSNNSINTMKVDWVRTWELKDKPE